MFLIMMSSKKKYHWKWRQLSETHKKHTPSKNQKLNINIATLTEKK